ncbi:MAG: hypothetical protein ABW185_12700 [Sedimenticola sp.]
MNRSLYAHSTHLKVIHLRWVIEKLHLVLLFAYPYNRSTACRALLWR